MEGIKLCEERFIKKSDIIPLIIELVNGYYNSIRGYFDETVVDLLLFDSNINRL